MEDINLDDEGWSAVKVGPDTLGWIGPNTPASTSVRDATVTILMGDSSFPLDVLGFCVMQQFSAPDDRFNGFLKSMLAYSRSFVVRVPEGSLDVSDKAMVVVYPKPSNVDLPPISRENIVFSRLSVDTLLSALMKFFTACTAKIQSELHELDAPVEVVRKYAELSYYRYPEALRGALTWRGRLLNGLSEGTTLRVRAIRVGVFENDYHSILWNLANLPASISFSSLVQQQTREVYGCSRVSPENVFIVKASSDEEYEMGMDLLRRREIAENYLIAARPDMLDASFFLCQKGDTLEDWIDGEELSLEEFAKVSGSERMEVEHEVVNPGAYDKELIQWNALMQTM